MRWAFNPIALAQVAVSGAQKGSPWPDSWAAVEALFGQAYKADATAVFYGSSGAPALIDVLSKVADAVPKAETLASLRRLPAVRALEARLANPAWLPRLLAFIVPVSDLGFSPPGAEDPIPTENPIIGSYEKIGAVKVGSVSWLDPEQGCTNDCYLIAAMIALAWARPHKWRQTLADATQAGEDKLTVDFFGKNKNAVDPPPFDVPARVPLDAGHNWIYAHSTDHDETWPALIERAFVMLHANLLNGEPTVDDYRDIGRDMFPSDAARVLMGGTSILHLGGVVLKPYDFVVERCDESVAVSPTMASTRKPAELPAADWTQSTLVGDHAYAVLGLTVDNGVNFVVLRNPHGNNAPVPGAPSGDWAAGAALNEGLSVKLGQHGVIAVSEQSFNKFFESVDGIDKLPADVPVS